ncbi:ankyrin repeat and fibronectin type-III domain-containing protein 1-like isoform X1 [Onychostruthus taczanowskii]|uniref:ankyrin repeat and fibronectin type-III domain-containing protein 1-like isoform X1 n=2 Tax=Onychostruthus taczanowskii TaxID=356909 RepID=UPI001B8083CF|nr:ankyrin repeat and fibronectin type-III domain-containing protein 1-like isoform X1 [Onychostruthus taczanowskii]XP_041264842.1 ankyrin repeat and fibronectin type-III domain-containing protein 1-like isoform X1 [Onychostruthus taczanowskii]XP_041264850.1 ankyrin repeat and fibronectin type-III domain-containing protein 1-like isoform X1 [Onychostruthus taczanowskii]XP_041264858.1 ankyrin repeat and fibronectin type-III domain-containing protein 1-like isoform X1 [Onychostruthus taczanowskii]
MPEQKPYKKHSASEHQKGCTVPSAGEAWRLEDDCSEPPRAPQLGTAVEDAPFSYFRTRSFYMRKSLSVDNHLGSLSYAVHPAESKAERVRTKLRRQFSLGSADKKDFYQPKSESSLARFAHRLSVKQKQEKRRKAEYGSAELSAFRPRSLSIEWSSSPKMTQQMRDLQLAQARKPPGPSSPNAAKRLYRNLSGKFRVNYTSFDEGSLVGRGEKEKLRKSYLFQSNAALFEAVELQDLDRVQEMLKHYSPEELDLNTPNSEGLLPLDIAIMTNNAPIARALLQAGAKESPHFVSLESRSLHLSTLVREAEQRVNELMAQVVNEAPNTDCSEKEKQLKAWEWRFRLYKRMKAGFEHARVPDAPSSVHLSVASSSSLQVTFWEPLSVNSAVVTKYKVEWSCSPTFSPLLGEAMIDKLKDLHFTIQGLVSGTAYHVRVSAYNMKGWGPPQVSVPPFAIPSNWREYDGRAPRRRGQAEALDHLLGQVKTVHQHCICHEPCKNQPQSRKHSVSKSLKHLFHPGSKFLKTLKRGLYLTAIFYKDDNILVTHEDQIPVVEIDDTYSCLLMQDFLWLTKVSCMWDEILWLRQCVTVSQSSCSCILQTRFKMLLAISQMQGLLGIQDLGQVFFEPIKDKQGNILVVTLKEVKTNQTFESVRWVPICKLQTSRKSVSSPEEPTALDMLLISIQDKLAYHQRSSHALSSGLYLGYLKLCSAVDQIRVLVPEQLPNILCHVKIRSNPNISREEWEWLQKMASVEEPVPTEPETDRSQNPFFQELQVAIKELMTLVNIPLQEAKDFRLYSQEVLDFGDQVSFLLLLPPSDDVCTAPGQNNPYTPRSGFLTLPLQIFELVHFFTYNREFITQYCQVSALLELESLLSQQSLREAFSDAELSTAKQRHQQVQDYIQQMEEIWREMRWIMDVLQHARYKQPSCGISLSGFLCETGGPVKEKTRSSSSHLDYLPSPVLSPETSRKLNSADSHGLSDEEGSSEVFLATDSDYDSSRAQSPKELDLVCSTSGPECCGRRAARTLRDSAPDVLQSHELKSPPPVPPPPEEPRPPKLYDSDFVLPSRQIELLRITEKRQAYCVRTSSLDFPKPHCPAPRKSCPGSVDSSPAESRTAGPCGQPRPGAGSTASPERRRAGQGSEPVCQTRSDERTQDLPEQQPEQPGGLADQGKKQGSVTLRVCPQYETGLSRETSVKLHITSQTPAREVVKLVVLEMNDISRGVLGGSAAVCYGEEQLEHFGLVFAANESEQWLPDDFLPLSLHTSQPEGRFYVRIKETSPLVLQYGPATTV